MYLDGSDNIAVSNAVLTQAENGQTAYGWGNHATNGYLTAYSETDPIWSAVSNTVTTGAAAGATAVQRAGDTMTGSLKTTVDHLAVAPTSDELVSAAWVRSLAMTGQEWFFTDVSTNVGGQKTANMVQLSADAPATEFTNQIASPVASDTYLAGGVATQMFGSVRSPITFEIYMARNGGNASTVIPVHPEIYYIYNGTTNHLGDWESLDQTVTATTPTKYTFTIAFPEPTITGSVWIVGYLKSGTVSGTAAGLDIFGGGVTPSHMDISGVPAGETAADVAADLAEHEALTGANVHGLGTMATQAATSYGPLASANTWAADQTFSKQILIGEHPDFPVASTTHGMAFVDGGTLYLKAPESTGDARLTVTTAGAYHNGSQLVKSSRSITVNGVSGTLASNVTFTVSESDTLQSVVNRGATITNTTGITYQQAATNVLYTTYWTASNRWAMVQIIGATTNVTFVSP
jgi:hypothetical protein